MIDRPYSTVLVSTAAHVATITLNRPERRNAIGPQMTNELLYALADASDDPEVRCVVMTGAGNAFCAGGDFTEMAGGAQPLALPPRGDFADLLLALMHTRKPVVARINGHALGGGLGLAAACTLAVAADHARFGTPEINVGVFPMMIMAVLARTVSRRQFLEMALLGDKFSAEQALQLGLINRIAPADQLDQAVGQLTAALVDKSPIAMRLGLEAYVAQQDATLEAALPMLAVRLQTLLGTDDAREGLMAFLEKRKPSWSGH